MAQNHRFKNFTMHRAHTLQPSSLLLFRSTGTPGMRKTHGFLHTIPYRGIVFVLGLNIYKELK